MFNNDAKGIDAVNRTHQLELMRKEAERRVERNKDAARRILDDLTVQVFMSLMKETNDNHIRDSGYPSTHQSSSCNVLEETEGDEESSLIYT